MLGLRPEEAEAWSTEEVARRWQRLCRGASLVNVDETVVAELVAVWRERLCDVSWFMRSVNECVARQANAEDGCKGRFWEGRFRSQALLDEAAVLGCMTYVDLNPVRTGLVDAPEDGEFTSIRQRVLAYRAQQAAEVSAALSNAPLNADADMTAEVESNADGMPPGLDSPCLGNFPLTLLPSRC